MYKALDKATNSLVAIKVIPLTEQDNEDFATIQKEIAFLSDCNHPNIVKYLVGGAGCVRMQVQLRARDDSWPHSKILGPFGHGVPACWLARAGSCCMRACAVFHTCRAATAMPPSCGSSWSTAGEAASAT